MKSLYKDEEGAYTLEAAFVLPGVFLAILVLLFFCMYLYQNALLGQAAAVAAERTSYSWDNSHRNSRTGAYEGGVHDSLYWRLSDDGMLQAIFGWSDETGPTVLNLPADGTGNDSLPLKKLGQTSLELPESIEGKMTYSHGVMRRTVEADFQRQLPLAVLKNVLGEDPNLSVQSVSYVVEPAEWIRTVELARYYTAKFRKSGNGREGTSRSEAAKALKLYGK
ncbi:TadE family protein [Paenibacillus caui]|uniref:TadE family protein n=1 Tax=Paenibacillus caui TaxID=2873927 RepID=UPI001CA7D0A4|nr:TadE family protein [Paenibacillus caui]